MLSSVGKKVGVCITTLMVMCTCAHSRGVGASKEEWCASQAQALIKQKNWDIKNTDTYVSHFNPILHRCFMAIERRQDGITSKMLLDAYAQQTFASYFEMQNMPMLKSCVLLPGTKEERKCDSNGDYESFVARYMQRTP